jgi:hypothetical protein
LIGAGNYPPGVLDLSREFSNLPLSDYDRGSVGRTVHVRSIGRERDLLEALSATESRPGIILNPTQLTQLVIAEEVGAVVPEVVSYEENGKDARGVDYSRLTALLIEATKQQQREIRQEQAANKEQQRELAKASSQIRQQQNLLRRQAAAMESLKAEVREDRETLRKVKAQVDATQPTLRWWR